MLTPSLPRRPGLRWATLLDAGHGLAGDGRLRQ